MKKITLALLAAVTCALTFAQAPASKTARSIQIYTTANGTDLRISPNGQLSFSSFGQPLETQPCIFIDPQHTFQTFLGIGGALTDASAETFAKLPKSEQQAFLTACYDRNKGIGYTIGRTNIHSCDFSSDTYTYVRDNDSTLSSFNVAHDEQYRIPFIKQVLAAAGGRLKLFVSPWSPPAWMKDNHDILHGGHLMPAYSQAWANYYIKFIKTYEAKGIPVWGLSVQNEPMATQRWESCIYTAEEERDFIKNYLGPTLQRQGMSGKKLIAWDHNRDLMYQRASVILNDPKAAAFVWAIGYHWYETWTGSPMMFDNERRVQQAFPDKALMFTEGCKEAFNLDSVYNWSLGEKYGYSLVNDFNCGTVAWTDWNVLLDEKGGPNHVGNFCFAPIHADTRTGKLIFTNAYYYIGHFSKFILPGAKRISISSSRPALQSTGFLNPDGSVVVVVLNTTNDKMPYHLWMKGQAAATESLPHSITTFIIRP